MLGDGLSTKASRQPSRTLRRALIGSALFVALGMFVPQSGFSQQRQNRPLSAPSVSPASGNYSSNLVVIREAQQQALTQAREMMNQIESDRDRVALQAAIKEMERSQEALEAAEKSPEKLAAATAAQQNAYQALLKMMPREYRMQRSQRNQNQGRGQSGQPQRQQMEQLEMSREENRYETERQARAEATPQQREQLETSNKLRELAQRQQDLNERLRELQTALQAARTEPEKEELRRELKRLQDEQRQMLADVDQMRQEMEQSSNATSEAREQMEQTRADMQRAAEEMQNESASGALAAGTRAQQNMQNLRDELRRQASSQFTDQMRDMRNDARELARRQEEIARQLDQLENGRERSLDNSRERQELVRQMTQQHNALTNLLSNMRAVTEQAENTEPLLSKQLYDTLRRADQARTDEMLQMGAQLAERGFLPQASEVERGIRQNVNDLRQSIERAAESVLGNEAESLRYAERELNQLSEQIERELAGGGATNSLAGAGRQSGSETNRLGEAGGGMGMDRQGQSGQQARTGEREGNEPGGRGSERSNGQPTQAGSDQPGTQSGASEGTQVAQAQTGQRGEGSQQNEQPSGQGNGTAGQGEGQEQRSGNQQAQNGDRGQRGQSGQQGQSGRSDQGNQGGERSSPTEGQGQIADANPQSGGGGGGRGGGGRDGDRLRQIAEQIGAGNDGRLDGGPITGGGFVNWADRLRDVERVLEDPELRNELASVRERVAAMRAEFRESGRRPSEEVLKHNIVKPLSEVRVWLRQELARRETPEGLVPLDRDPVPETFSELVRQYYENLGTTR